MRWLKLLLVGIIILFIVTVTNILFPQQFITFFSNLGLHAIAGFVSGPWWRAAPTWVLALGALLGVWITIKQSNNTRTADITLRLFHEVTSVDFRYKLELVNSIDRENLQWMTTKEKQAAEYIIGWFNVYGSLVRNEVIENDSAIFETTAQYALISWYQLGKYVRELQKNCSLYGEYFEDFVHLCCANYKRKSCCVRFSKIDGTILVDDLAQTITKENYPFRPRTLRQIINSNKTIPASTNRLGIISYGMLYFSFSLIILTLKNDPNSQITSQQIYIAYAYLVLSVFFALWAICTTKIGSIPKRFTRIQKVTGFLSRHRVMVYLAFSVLALLAWFVVFAFDFSKGITGSVDSTQAFIAIVGGLWMLCLLTSVTWSFFRVVNEFSLPRWLPFLVPVLVLLLWIINSGVPQDWITGLELGLFIAFPSLVASGLWSPYGEMPFLENQ